MKLDTPMKTLGVLLEYEIPYGRSGMGYVTSMHSCGRRHASCDGMRAARASGCEGCDAGGVAGAL